MDNGCTTGQSVTFHRTIREHGIGILLLSLALALVLVAMYYALSNTMQIERMEEKQAEYQRAASSERTRISDELSALKKAIDGR